ncbi:MAG TPA: orotate phosphoribosyltransferase [Candidatus Dormibacteraeota bacterium]|nr:orotate phosphoribosyltransferase [Candidatus Dormibacteraeota bacterium]
MSPTDLDLRNALVQRGALLEGHFRLSSGRHSNRFVQKFRILEDPVLLEKVAREFSGRFRSLDPTVVVGAAVGGILLAYEVARQLGTKAIFVEKENGIPVLRRGFTLGRQDRALLVEDVVTTGLSIRETIDVAGGYGAEIVGIGVIVLRQPFGSAQPFDSALDDKRRGGIPTHVLLELPLLSYDAAKCPECLAGEPVTDPGSRRS